MSLSLDQLREGISAVTAGRAEPFDVLREVSKFVHVTQGTSSEAEGQELVIRLLDAQPWLEPFREIVDSLAREAGLFPYLSEDSLTLADAIAYEMHRPMDGFGKVFHRVQAQVFRTLMKGRSVVLSAPTSFGKSLIIDAVVASHRHENIAIVVPTLSLLDETRRRLMRYSDHYKIITHSSQLPGPRNIFVHTQERVVDNQHIENIDFFVIDEFYKLDPSEDADRAQTLNLAFHKLARQAKQFYMLGPNIQNIPSAFVQRFKCDFVRTDFNTVVTEVIRRDVSDEAEDAISLASTLDEPTLIYVRSPNRAHAIATRLAKELSISSNAEVAAAADWVRANYHPKWSFAKALASGVGIHHGKLPRSLTQLTVRLFNEGAIPYLVCTSTLIEGVNTRAKNVIVLDNKIALKKLDYFTYSNIKGRSGRMFQHFIGRVYIYKEPPQPELPLIDIPVVTQSEDASESLLIQLEPGELSPKSSARVNRFFNNDILNLDVLRQNAGIEPEAQIALAQQIRDELPFSRQMLTWDGYPTYDELEYACELIWRHFTDGRRRSEVSSGRQLAFLLNRLMMAKSFAEAVKDFQKDEDDVDDAIEKLFDFQRQWAEFRAPRLLGALNRIQKYIFQQQGHIKTGSYDVYIFRLENVGRNPIVNALDEYGLPVSIGRKVWIELGRPDTLDAMLDKLRVSRAFMSSLSAFERKLVHEVQASLRPTYS
ncbi:DEAD/DEAH box helicase [Burkholderia sp. 22PA0099]|uniref:DEAD/DEAH box helicase n=1 Tax=Burkholderia sp. 22PA0099 TaxID=3237372 RepID=UPI0039C369A4